VSGQLHAPAALLLGKETLVPIGYGAGWVGPVAGLDTAVVKRKIPALTRTRTPDQRKFAGLIIIRVAFHDVPYTDSVLRLVNDSMNSRRYLASTGLGGRLFATNGKVCGRKTSRSVSSYRQRPQVTG
jgi:hypothetical protein